MNPKTNEIVFALIDELIDAFEAKAFHVGMDEVFLLSSEHAPSTKDLDPADVFAKVVNDLHGHIVKKRGLTMLMWADRLIDGDQFNMGEWEASKVGTAPAVDKIPKDIILCPWHYELRRAVRVAADVHGEGLSHSAGKLEEHGRHAGADSLRARAPNRRPPRRPHLHHLVAAARQLGRVRAAGQRLGTAAMTAEPKQAVDATCDSRARCRPARSNRPATDFARSDAAATMATAMYASAGVHSLKISLPMPNSVA